MCGIAGIIKRKPSNQPLNKYIEKMTQTMAHRGPDDEGYLLSGSEQIYTCGGNDTFQQAWGNTLPWFCENRVSEMTEPVNLAFGHRRLSVIDTTANGHQPMCSPDQRYWIVLNGEIYNYIEIRNELLALGHSFIGNSDTEVLLHAYQTWSSGCLNKLDGMWSFVIYDRFEKTLFGSRDRTGVKPLYYFLDEAYLCFASEPKALLSLPFIHREVDTEALAAYFMLDRIDFEGKTLYSQIKELQPAHCFTYDLKTHQFAIEKYYSLSFNKHFGKFNSHTAQGYISETRNHLFDSVEKRLRSDIPVGFCLSGGIDSTAIVSMARELLMQGKAGSLPDGQIIAFTAVNDDKITDERAWAEKVVQKSGIKWVKTTCEANGLLARLPEIIKYQDAPLISTTTYAQFKTMESVAEHGIRVVIDGQGGDELFAGYVPFYTAQYLDFIRNGQFGKWFHEIGHQHNSPYSLKLFGSALLKMAFEKGLPQSVKSNLAMRFKPELPYLFPEVIEPFRNHLPLSRILSTKGINELLAEYYSGPFLKNLLRWEDRCSMRFSVESRTPMADDVHLAEYVFNLPGSYKIHEGWSKYLLRQSMKDIMPAEITLRTDKKGFSTPESKWLQQINRQMFEQINQLPDPIGLIDRKKLLIDWDAIFSQNNMNLHLLTFKYLNYLIWVNQ